MGVPLQLLKVLLCSVFRASCSVLELFSVFLCIFQCLFLGILSLSSLVFSLSLFSVSWEDLEAFCYHRKLLPDTCVLACSSVAFQVFQCAHYATYVQQFVCRSVSKSSYVGSSISWGFGGLEFTFRQHYGHCGPSASTLIIAFHARNLTTLVSSMAPPPVFSIVSSSAMVTTSSLSCHVGKLRLPPHSLPLPPSLALPQPTWLIQLQLQLWDCMSPVFLPTAMFWPRSATRHLWLSRVIYPFWQNW